MATHIRDLERSLQRTNHFIHELQTNLGWDDEQRVYTALRATLQQLRNRLTIEEATDFAAQLPLILKGVFYDGWNPSKTPEKIDKTAFLNRIHAHLNNNPNINPDLTVRIIFLTLKDHITGGEIDHVRNVLPKDIASLWGLEII